MGRHHGTRLAEVGEVVEGLGGHGRPGPADKQLAWVTAAAGLVDGGPHQQTIGRLQEGAHRGRGRRGRRHLLSPSALSSSSSLGRDAAVTGTRAAGPCTAAPQDPLRRRRPPVRQHGCAPRERCGAVGGDGDGGVGGYRHGAA